MKKSIFMVTCGAIIIAITAFFIGQSTVNQSTTDQSLEPLPTPELADGARGTDYGIDKNINESTIDNYLNRDDTVYRFMLLLEDTATWENKGGTRNITGFIEGFEVVPYPYLTAFPDAYVAQKESENVHNLYSGDTLFSLDEDGNYIANYEESMSILESLFPKDKNIILMCGAGGYANFTKKMLIALGWDESKIYNAGGYWYYEGDHSIQVEYTNSLGETEYAFWKIAYHDIDFSRLTKLTTATLDTETAEPIAKVTEIVNTSK